MSFFDRRVVAVSGAAGGVGFATAGLLCEQGARVAMLDARNDEVQTRAKELSDAGHEVVGIGCDITDEGQVEAAASTVRETLGGCYGLVNSAGVLSHGGLEDLELADWNRVIGINLTGVFLTLKHFGRCMIEAGEGSIVTVTSLARSSPSPRSGAYSPSKAGAEILTRQAALEWGRYGIRVNAINPGLIDTPMTERFNTDPDIRAKRAAIVPIGRIANPIEIAEVIVFLLSDRASYLSGASINVDGGLEQTRSALMPRPGVND